MTGLNEIKKATKKVLAETNKTKTGVREGPRLIHATPSAPSLLGSHRFVEFLDPPFPYHGNIPTGERGEPETPFLNADPYQRRFFHMAPRGGKLYEDRAYYDPTSFLYIPLRFDSNKPATVVLFLHGNLAKLERDVVERQHVPQQLEASGINAVLVAPQLAVDALDSSAGKFWQPGFLDAYLEEAAIQLGNLPNSKVSSQQVRQSPVVIVAFSGGYLSAAYALANTVNQKRIRGVILLDALFGEETKFARWIENNSKTTFFVSAYSEASKGLNAQLTRALVQQQLSVITEIPPSIIPGMIIIKASLASVHNDFVTRAWCLNPLQVLLRDIDRRAVVKLPDGTAAIGKKPNSKPTVSRKAPINPARGAPPSPAVDLLKR